MGVRLQTRAGCCQALCSSFAVMLFPRMLLALVAVMRAASRSRLWMMLPGMLLATKFVCC